MQFGVPAFEQLQSLLAAMTNDDLKKVMGPITNSKTGLLQLLRDFQVRRSLGGVAWTSGC
jgi:hypothetical protein